MEEICLDYAQYCDFRALVTAESERRGHIISLWSDQSNECAEFYISRGKAISKRERDEVRALYLKLTRERLAKVKPKDLTVEEMEYFTRWQLLIEEDETWERLLLIREWDLIGRAICRIFRGCIYHHYEFSFDLRNYKEVRQLTSEDLKCVRPVDRHLPTELLQKLHQKREIAAIEKQKPFERLRELVPDVNF